MKYAVLTPNRPMFGSDNIVAFEVEKLTPKTIWRKGRGRKRYSRDEYLIEVFSDDLSAGAHAANLRQKLGVNDRTRAQEDWRLARELAEALMKTHASTTEQVDLPERWEP